MGIKRDPRIEPLKLIADTVSKQGPTLAVLDHFDHLIPTGVGVIKSLIDAAPDLRFVITSRERLGLEGEKEVGLQPLPVPRKPGNPDRLMEFAGVQLFVDRARLVNPRFQITTKSAPAVGALCQR